MEKAKAAPTGCYKCGRPGHWSRDCPDSNPKPNHQSNNLSNSGSSRSFNNSNLKAAAERPKKLPRTRPKLTAEMLLGDDGLGYVLRHFPRNFKYRGSGHEVADLGNLLRLYYEWHSRLLPYYSFDQFVHKVEQVAASKRVKTCLRDLRERVAGGGDPTKLQASPTEYVDPILGEDHLTLGEAAGLHDEGSLSLRSNDADALLEDMLHDILDRATEEPSQTLHNGMDEPTQLTQINNDSLSYKVVLLDEQRSRIEANRLNTLERAAASSLSNEAMTDKQRARMEASRLKALERAAARARSLQ